MNLATQLANQTSSKEINPDYECNGTLKTPLDISPIEPLKDGKTVHDGRVDDKQYTEGIFTKDKIKVENPVFEEDSPMMTNVSTKDTVIEEEKPNSAITSDSGMCDSNSLICHASEAFMQAERNKCCSEENEALCYVKVEEISTEESYEAVEARYCPIMTNESTKDTFIKEEKPNSIIKSDSGICDSNSLSYYARQALIEAEKNQSGSEENEPLRYVKKEELAIAESYVMNNEAVEGVSENCNQLACTMNPTSTCVKKEKRDFTGHERVHSYLTKHERLHTKDRPFQCTICSKRFVLKRSLNVHGQKMHAMNSPFKCASCGKGFAEKSHLTKHELWHTRDRPFQCAICSKRYKFKWCLKFHRQSKHTKDLPFQCAICGQGFTYKSNLTQHERMHTKDPPFQCAICGKGFTYKSNLIQHERMHTDDRPFQCAICSKRFTQKSNLTTHQRLHSDRPFQCAICSKGFTYKSNFIKHERMHTNDRPFQCAICSKSFKQKCILRVHERIHTKDRLFHCAICSKGFVQKHYLAKHEQVHSKDRPFWCAICCRGFMQKSRLTSHEQVHINGRPFECTICSKRFILKHHLNAHEQVHIKERFSSAPTVQNYS